MLSWSSAFDGTAKGFPLQQQNIAEAKHHISGQATMSITAKTCTPYHGSPAIMPISRLIYSGKPARLRFAMSTSSSVQMVVLDQCLQDLQSHKLSFSDLTSVSWSQSDNRAAHSCSSQDRERIESQTKIFHQENYKSQCYRIECCSSTGKALEAMKCTLGQVLSRPKSKFRDPSHVSYPWALQILCSWIGSHWQPCSIGLWCIPLPEMGQSSWPHGSCGHMPNRLLPRPACADVRTTRRDHGTFSQNHEWCDMLCCWHCCFAHCTFWGRSQFLICSSKPSVLQPRIFLYKVWVQHGTLQTAKNASVGHTAGKTNPQRCDAEKWACSLMLSQTEPWIMLGAQHMHRVQKRINKTACSPAWKLNHKKQHCHCDVWRRDQMESRDNSYCSDFSKRHHPNHQLSPPFLPQYTPWSFQSDAQTESRNRIPQSFHGSCYFFFRRVPQLSIVVPCALDVYIHIYIYIQCLYKLYIQYI